MAKIDTLFMTKMAEKPHTYIAHIREYPPGIKYIKLDWNFQRAMGEVLMFSGT